MTTDERTEITVCGFRCRLCGRQVIGPQPAGYLCARCEERKCDNCGKKGGQLVGRDGEERRENDVYLCDECYRDLPSYARIIDDPRERGF